MRILITGGSGTIGKAFIREFPEHTYYNVSRNEKFLTDLMREHPKTKSYIGNIEDEGVFLHFMGGFQLEFVSIIRVINHMTCYNRVLSLGPPW